MIQLIRDILALPFVVAGAVFNRIAELIGGRAVL
mgnify:CR=1 FL=1